MPNPGTPNPVTSARARYARYSWATSDPAKRDAARRELTEVVLDRAIREALAIAPPLSDETRTRLAALLAPR